MIDVHAHVLPGLDDGPSKLGDSLEMVGVDRPSGGDSQDRRDAPPTS